MIKRIITLGDSTMQFNNHLKFPQTGWPQALERFVRVPIINFALNGRSTKSFIEQGWFDKAINEVTKDDLVLIEFGHNDSKIEDPSRYTDSFGEYQKNLEFMAKSVIEKGAIPILLTPITERKFENGVLLNTHKDYPDAVKDLSKKLNIICIDLFTETRNIVIAEGEILSKRFYMNFDKGLYENKPEGSADDTHLRYDGAFMVANCFYKELKKLHLFDEIFIEK